ncbi:polysaccharide pyruvyl transferase family protein [Paracoccus aeridis]|uniref:polysaccharide pyruvyl transferase family protein n=1 Tax=Paracoccus aeridis TaxID=1966466 RepID=UPI0010AB3070|nr:polysaccharide pyruvyl transferase family protein [Paracoccus aeridis]
MDSQLKTKESPPAIRARAVSGQPTIPFRYYNVIRNCGDAITSYILQESFGVQGRVSEAGEEHLLAIGSIFFMANRKSNIWGSGVLDPKAGIPGIDSSKVHALRGRKTVEYLSGLGYKLPDLPLGDPGIFVDELVDVPATSKYRAAIVPHHTGFHSDKWDRARHSAEFCVVDMMDDSLEPLRRISEAQVVLSQSLHGLIFAAALGKPYLWISGHSSEVWNWKFLDWFSTCENGQLAPVLLNVSLDDMLALAEPRRCTASKADLRSAFPMQLVDHDTKVRGDFRTSRMLSPAHVFFESSGSAETEDGTHTWHEFTAKVAKLRSRVFVNSPEPTYLAITLASAAHQPSRADLVEGQRYLDVNREAQLLWYPGNVDFSKATKFLLSDVRIGETDLRNGTILVRPDGHIGKDGRFAVATLQ